MMTFLEDPTTNAPKARDAFGLSATPNQDCRTCKMFALCTPELRDGGAAEPVAL
jgi:hypothetical protein